MAVEGGNLGTPSPTTPAPAPPAAEPATPATPATPAAAPSVTDGYTGLPSKYAADEFFKGKDLDEILTEYKTLHQLQTARENNGLVTLINEKSTPEEVEAFYSKLGKPKSAAEYELARPEDLPAGIDFSDELMGKFAQMAHKWHLTKDQARGLFADYHEMIKEQFAANAAYTETLLANNLAELEAAWGGPVDSDKFKANQALAIRAFNSVATPDLAAAFKDQPEIASNPLVLQVLAKLGAKMEPDTAPTVLGTQPSGQFMDSLSAVESKIKKFHADGKFKAMLDPKNANHKELRQEWQDLNDARRRLIEGQ